VSVIDHLSGPEDLAPDEREAVETLLYRLADDEFVLAERYTEWQVRSPTLESDLALSNIAQDELGHARLWYDLLEDFGHEEADLLWERDPETFTHSTLVELPFESGDWADPIVRSYLYDEAEHLRLQALEDSSYPRLEDRVGKVQGEERYHREHATNWLERLASTEEGHERVQTTLDRLFPHALTLFQPVDPEIEARIDEYGIRTQSLDALGQQWLETVVPFLESLGLAVPIAEDGAVTADDLPETIGRDANHTEDWFDLYEEFTYTYHDLGRDSAERIMSDPDDQ